MQKTIWRKYVWQRQTPAQLAVEYQRGKRWVQKQLDASPLSDHQIIPQPVVAISDVTFFGRGYGILVVRCSRLKRNVYWKEVAAETPAELRGSEKEA